MPKRESKSLVPAEIVNTKITLSLKTLLIILGVVAGVGGGSFGVVRIATMGDVQAAEKRVENKIIKEKKERKVYEAAFDARLDVQKAATTDLKNTVSEVQEVQHWQVADQAAERVSKKAPKPRREGIRMDLFKENIRRLKDKKAPCSNLDCTNTSR
jgi:hypothetical protein